jgi:hypothetical protein
MISKQSQKCKKERNFIIFSKVHLLQFLKSLPFGFISLHISAEAIEERKE